MSNFNYKEYKPKTHYAIEASAGTGKTFSINKIVRTLVETENISLDKILIVTYTEKATEELKDRIRDELSSEKNIVDTSCAPIFTIHSFCKSMIDEFGVTLNQPLHLDLVNDLDLDSFIDRFIRNSNVLEDLFKWPTNKESQIETLKDLFKNSLSKYYLNKKYQEESGIIELDRLNEFYINGKKQDDASIIDFFAKIYEKCKKGDSLESFEDLVPELIAFKEEDILTDKGQEFYNIIKDTKNMFNFNGNEYRASIMKGNPKLLSAYEAVKNLKDALKDMENKNVICYLVVLKYLKELYQAWDEEKEKNKKLEFSDMIRTVREAVINNTNGIVDLIRSKYTYAIIDEFQDTNQLQFDVFKTLFMCDNHYLIVVGDPKQSIYSFQGADVHVYDKAVKEIEDIGGVVSTLSTNFRSSKEMVESCNSLFESSHFGFSNFTPSLVGKNKQSILNGEPLREAFWLSDENIDKYSYANIVAEYIIDLCSYVDGKTKLQLKDGEIERNVTFKDFTILGRTRKELGIVKSVLAKKGIPFIMYKDDTLYKSNEWKHFITILEAILSIDFTGYNRGLFKRALKTDFFGYDLSEINKEIFDSDSSFELKLINKWKMYYYEKKYDLLINSIINDSYLHSNLNKVQKLPSFGIYKQISKIIQNYLDSGSSLEEIVKKMNNLSNDNENDENVAGYVELSTNLNLVKLMTIHASKGLQFPVVISVAGFGAGKNKLKANTYYEGDSKKLLVGFTNDSIKNEKLKELKRLSYVAYTRAEYILMLPRYKAFKKNDFLSQALAEYIINNNGKFRILEPLNISKDALTDILTINNKQTTLDNNILEKHKENVNSLVKKIYILSSHMESYSSLSHGTRVIHDEEVNDKEDIIDADLTLFDKLGVQIDGLLTDVAPLPLPVNYPKGADLGTALHEIFEKLDFTIDVVNEEKKIKELITDCFTKQRLNIDEDIISSTFEMVKNVIEAKLPVIHNSNKENEFFKLKDITMDNRKQEIKFNYRHSDNLITYFTGFIDLIIKRGEYYSILDWKSDKLSDIFLSYSDREELKKQVDRRYSIQRTLYAYTLIKWLKNYYDEEEEEIFEKHFGGVYYVFLRGCINNTTNGIYCHTWKSFSDLESSYNEIVRGLK